jgi:intein/homing endonuclease
MSIKALQEYTYISRYARFNKLEQRRETWNEAVDRVEQMHIKKFPNVTEDINWAFDLVRQRRVLGSQRALQFGGKPIEQKNARMFNCCVSFCDRVRFFQETLWLLLCGCGTGFSVQQHHIAKLPDYTPLRKGLEKKKFVIPDSIEGWSDALGILMAGYLPGSEFTEWEDCIVTFDYSLIRPAGSALASGVGKAPGPMPLRRALETIRKLLDDRRSKFTRLRPIDAYDIVMHASDAVLSGGVRRSATICLFSPEDQEMMKAKTGNWFSENPQRARSNNSVLLIRSETTKEQFDAIMKDVKDCGEPGFYFSDSTEQLVNPCVTADTVVSTSNGLDLVGNLVGKPFDALVEGKIYESTAAGFWKTGFQPICKLTFASGRQLKVTLDHKILTTSGWKTANALSFNDEIVINNHREMQNWWNSASPDFAKGYCLGNFLTNGEISNGSARMSWWGDDKDVCCTDGLGLLSKTGWSDTQQNSYQKTNPYEAASIDSVSLYGFAESKGCIKEGVKSLSKEAISGNWSYLSGLVAGYFDANSMVAFDSQYGSSLTVHSVSAKELQLLQIVLNSFGVYSKICEFRMNEDCKTPNHFYAADSEQELVITGDNIEFFMNNFRLRNTEKLEKLKRIVNERKRLPSRTHFVDALTNKELCDAEDVYDCTIPEVSAFDANGVYVHNCVEIGMWPVHFETKESGWQMCVSGDTTLLTKNGRVNIGESVDKEVEIWNGKSWKKVKPFQTGKGRKLYRVQLSDGSYLDCTSNHKWLVKDRFQKEYSEVETSDLMGFSKYAISTPAAKIKWNGVKEVTSAYEMGFILGDGCCKRTDTADGVRKPFATLFGHDHDLDLNCRILQDVGGDKYNVKATNVTFDGLDRKFCHTMKYSAGLPSEIFDWDRNSCLKFISGWIDSDGTKAGRGFRIYGEETKMRDLQLLLTKLGFYSSVNLMQKKGETTNYAVRKQDVWYVQVSDVGDIVSRRMEFSKEDRKQAGKGMSQVICSVVELDGLHDTYCVHEPESNTCVFNNVLTKQCNLCEINGKKIKNKEDFSKAARAAAIIGTLQASYTKFAYLGKTSEEIVEREALLGVSITGMMDNPDVIFDPATQQEMAKLVLETNAWMSKKIGINQAARATCIKPAGTTSCILGSASGIHPHHAKRYFRRVQGNSMETPLQYFKTSNPLAVEKSVWSANKTDEIITFCVEVPEGAKTKNQLSALKLLEHVKNTQQNWVTYGKNPECCTQPWLNHNVSNTINVRLDEWDGITDYIYENRDSFAGIALLPQSGDLDYPQAPMCTIHTSREIVQMYGEGSLFASGLIVDGLRAFDNNLWAACSTTLGQGHATEEGCSDKKDFVRRAKQFAERYFDGDVNTMTHCLKEVHNWKLWQDLMREYKDVDYSQMMESEDNTTPMETLACAGGSCEV